MKKTFLFEHHLKANAKMVEFAGWEMPISYSSLKNEILDVRKSCGVFDVSHMGEFIVEGNDAVGFIQELIPNDFSVPVGKAVYSPLLNNDGKMLDDLIFYKLSDTKVLICVNAANIEKDWNWISSFKERSSFDCALTNQSDSYSLLAVQGPKTESVLVDIFGDIPLSSVGYYEVYQFSNERGDWIFARTGYTGEDGFEVFCGNDQVTWLWEELMNRNVSPIGLGARDTLRLEVCYPLYGNDLSEELTPLDTALKWTVKMNKESFIGKKALENYKPHYRLIKFSLDKGIPREGYEVTNTSGDIIGKVTSGSQSPHLNKGIALALIEVDKFPEDKAFNVLIRGKSYPANYQTKPFIVGGHK